MAMRLIPPDLTIPEDDPFFHDLLERKEHGESLTQFVSTVEDPFVLSLDAPWGTGKTTFVKMLSALMRSKGIRTIYFNAWETDFSPDPLIGLMTEIRSVIEQAKPKTSKAEQHLQNFQRYGKAFLKVAAPAIVKIAVEGVTGLATSSELVKSTLGDTAEKSAQDAIKDYEDARDSIVKFREELASFVFEIRGGDTEDRKPPVVIFIDELDRCRPTYAVELLERVKHLFRIPGLFFVLSLDKRQLGHSLRCIYGSGMDVTGYLRRFIDLDYHLPYPKRGQFSNALFARFELKGFFESRKNNETCYDEETLRETLTGLFELFESSLRDQEKCFTLLSVCCRMTPPDRLLFPQNLAVLIALRMHNEPLYLKYINGQADRDEVLSYVRSLSNGQDFLNTNAGMMFEAAIVVGMIDQNSTASYMSEYGKKATDEQLPKEERERNGRIQAMIDHRNGMHGSPTAFLAKKLEIARRFE